MKSQIILEIEHEEKTCGPCRFMTPERESYRFYCALFSQALESSADEDHGPRCRQCLDYTSE